MRHALVAHQALDLEAGRKLAKKRRWYNLSSLDLENPISEVVDVQADVLIGLIDHSRINLFYSKLELLDDLLNNSSGTSDLSYTIFGDQERQLLDNFAQQVSALRTSLVSLEDDLPDEQISGLFENMQSFDLIDISPLIEEFSDYTSQIRSEGFASANESRVFTAFAEALRRRSANEFLVEYLFTNGFCELPLELIQAFEQEEDIQWGGVWNSNNVDYMHFEIRKAAISKYLNQKKP